MEEIQSIDISTVITIFGLMFGVLCALIALIWNNHENRVLKMEKSNKEEHDKLNKRDDALTKKVDDLSKLYTVMAEIRTDMKWIKNKFK